MSDCVPESASVNTSSSSHSILQSLSQQWPSLPALLLFGAVQRLCQLSQQQQHTELHDASVLADWVKLLLGDSHKGVPSRQQPSPGMSRARKRKSASSDAKCPPSAEGISFNPTASQLQACTAECLAALPASSTQTAGAVRQVVLQLLAQLQNDYHQEYTSWGSAAQALVDSCPESQEECSVQTAASSVDLHAAQKVQHSLIDGIQSTGDGDNRLVLSAWLVPLYYYLSLACDCSMQQQAHVNSLCLSRLLCSSIADQIMQSASRIFHGLQ